jgi:hypothetical protein
MQPSFWHMMEEARMRQAERLASAERARLRAQATPRLPRVQLTLRTAALLRQVADHLEARAIRTA